ncbi:hypothetical protein [Mesorhizobium sp. Cs1299R1N3]|uniref:hypothetical protein n=1 Tax=Mesorhizobium sp. Cs1299R1N3 TaxID=3015173 RepID=UPI00301D8D3D
MTNRLERARALYARVRQNSDYWRYNRWYRAEIIPPVDLHLYPSPDDEIPVEEFYFTAEFCGWRTGDGNQYEWWNIIFDGRIVGMEWCERSK